MPPALILDGALELLRPFSLPMALTDTTIDDAAQAAGMSSRSLRRLCQRELQMTWREYTQQARIMRAAVLLADPEMTVLQVATGVGFDSASAFTRAFGNAWGQPRRPTVATPASRSVLPGDRRMRDARRSQVLPVHVDPSTPRRHPATASHRLYETAVEGFRRHSSPTAGEPRLKRPTPGPQP